MTATVAHPQAALTYEVEVGEHGHVELSVPFSAGARLLVVVLPGSVDDFSDLLCATQTTLDFWDNALDDEDWNAA